MAPFELIVPERGRIPVVVEVPHAGLEVPESVQRETDVDRASILRDADIYVDELYADAPDHGASLLSTQLSRYVVDLNRAADDVDAATVVDHPSPRSVQPRGVVWRLSTDGRRVLRKPLRYEQLRARLAAYHTPYHDALRRELTQTRERFGYVILVAAHSMPSVGRSGHNDRGTRRADVVPGTQGRTSADARVIDLVDAHFREAGLSVRHDDPYRGGYTTQHYGRPAEACHVVQIELNRALYVHEDTGVRKPGDFEKIRALVGALVARLGALSLG